MFNKDKTLGDGTNPFKQKAQDWGKVKFVPKVPKNPRTDRALPYAATQWKTFKNDLVEKQREEDKSNAIDMNSSEAQELLKKREENYRRMLITEQSKQSTKWESFEDDKPATSLSSNKQDKTNDNPLLRNINLKNFDCKKLDFKQKNLFRKILTSGISKRSGANLQQDVESLKRDMEVKKSKKIKKELKKAKKQNKTKWSSKNRKKKQRTN